MKEWCIHSVLRLLILNKITVAVKVSETDETYSMSQKIPPWFFLTFFRKRLGIISPNFTGLLLVLIYAGLHFLLNYLQLWRSYAVLSATTIICSKCPPSVETHAGWSHLIWHSFVTVGKNWITYCSLAYIGTYNRYLKFGQKFPTIWEKYQKIPACVLAYGGHFELMVWTIWSHLIWHNFVKVADN